MKRVTIFIVKLCMVLLFYLIKNNEINKLSESTFHKAYVFAVNPNKM